MVYVPFATDLADFFDDSGGTTRCAIATFTKVG
jgi:hypothetical protein